MSAPAATQIEETDPLPCPFCGCTELVKGYWYIDDGEVDAWECSQCKAGAPQSVWNTRHSPTLESTPDWHYPQSNLDLPNMPAPGQIVVGYYYDGASNRGPVIMTPVHSDGSHIRDGASIYCQIVKWCAIPDEVEQEVASHE